MVLNKGVKHEFQGTRTIYRPKRSDWYRRFPNHRVNGFL